MKTFTQLVILTALVSPFAAFAGGDNDACKPVFDACAAQGFTKDETAPAGQKIWLNCADIILNKKEAVAKVDLKPDSFDANNCRDYRVAKDKFDAEWAKKHKKK